MKTNKLIVLGTSWGQSDKSPVQWIYTDSKARFVNNLGMSAVKIVIISSLVKVISHSHRSTQHVYVMSTKPVGRVLTENQT